MNDLNKLKDLLEKSNYDDLKLESSKKARKKLKKIKKNLESVLGELKDYFEETGGSSWELNNTRNTIKSVYQKLKQLYKRQGDNYYTSPEPYFGQYRSWDYPLFFRIPGRHIHHHHHQDSGNGTNGSSPPTEPTNGPVTDEEPSP